MLLKHLVPSGALRTVSRCMSSEVSCRRLTDRVAILTASTEGIGFAMARRLCQEGAKVVVSSRRTKNVDNAVKTLHSEGFTDVLGVQCDVAKREDREALVEQSVAKFGGIDVFVSNAGVNPNLGGVLDCSEEEWDTMFDINVKSSMFLTKLVVPYMKKKNKGSIIYLGTVGAFHPFNSSTIPNGNMLGGYCVSKTALLGLTKAVALQLAEHNIRVNSISPGIIRTRFASVLHEHDNVINMMLKNVPLGRVGEPDECAGLTAFLASDDSSFMTGENMIVAGGMPARM